MKYKMSVIIPMYNSEKYLEACLDSVLNQRLKEIKIILINDGSTDNSENIVNKYIKKYNNIKYIKTENFGQGHARNIGLKYIEGSYVGFVDSDDIIDENMFEEMYDLAIEKDLDMVICNHEYCYETYSAPNEINVEENKIYNQNEIIDMFLTEDSINGFSCNKIVKREIIENNNIKFEENMKYEDIPTIFQLILNCKKFSIIDKAFYKYIQREDSTTGSFNLEKLTQFFEALKKVDRLASKYNIKVDKNAMQFYFLKEALSIYATNNNKGFENYLASIIKEYSKNLLTNNRISGKMKIKIILLKIMNGRKVW